MRRTVCAILVSVTAGCAGLGSKPTVELHPSFRRQPLRTVAILPAVNRSDELDPDTSVTLWPKVRLPGQRRDPQSRANPILAAFRWAMARQLRTRGFRVVTIDTDHAAWKGLSRRERLDARAVGEACGSDAVCRLTMRRWQSRRFGGSPRVRFHTEYDLTRCSDSVVLWRCSRGSQLVRLSPGVEGSGIADAIARDVETAFATLP